MLNILTEQNVQSVARAAAAGRDVLISPDLGDLTFADFDNRRRSSSSWAKRAAREAAAGSRAVALPPEHTPRTRRRADRSRAPPATDRRQGRRRGHRAGQSRSARRRSSSRWKASRSTAAQVDADMRAPLRHRRFRARRLPAHRRARPARRRARRREKSWGPNYLRFGIGLSSDLQGEAFFNVIGGYRQHLDQQPGREWPNELESAARALRDRVLPAAGVSQTWFASAYGEVQREPQLHLRRRSPARRVPTC